MSTNPTVLSVDIEHSDIRKLRFKARATAVWSDATKGVCLEWFDDELNFVEADFIGKTQEEIIQLFMQRDKEYLQAP